jgi:hypothetical protein
MNLFDLLITWALIYILYDQLDFHIDLIGDQEKIKARRKNLYISFLVINIFLLSTAFYLFFK